MRGHNRVAGLKKTGDGVYDLSLVGGRVVRVFVCECYSFGEAEFIEVIGKIGPVDAVVISSNWCGYTLDAKRECRAQKVGIFTIGDFMAALNLPDAWGYLNEYEKEIFRKNNWL